METTILKDILDPLRKNLRERFQDDLKALILYGSWARGTAREDSDVDLLGRSATGRGICKAEASK
jgi:predicted nucleotidyltransferase